MLFEAYPIVLHGVYGCNAGITGLMFLAILVGNTVGTLAVRRDSFVHLPLITKVIIISQAIFYFVPKYNRLIDQYAPNPVPPEARLPMTTVGGILFLLTFFWFGWTCYPRVSYWAPMLSGIPFGASLIFIYVRSLPNVLFETRLTRSCWCCSCRCSPTSWTYTQLKLRLLSLC
jgi:hypothetical protein